MTLSQRLAPCMHPIYTPPIYTPTSHSVKSHSSKSRSSKSYELTEAGDRYFDGLAEKFSRSLYQAPRGELRLAMLDYLLPQMLHLEAQPVLDVGGGLGQLAAWLAERGHAVTMAEPSPDMLTHASAWHAERVASGALQPDQLCYLAAPLQSLPQQAPGPWPLITCHAVLEWLGEPQLAMQILTSLLAPGGQLSLMVFNRDALRFSNVVKGNLQKALSDQLAGKGKRQRLTPISPVTHDEICQWGADNGLIMEGVAGVRVFQDYLRQPPEKESDQAALLALEKQYCRQDPHWRLGRYLLYTFTKPEADV